MEKYNQYIDQGMEALTTYGSLYGLKILGALIIFFVGKWVVNMAVKVVLKLMRKARIDETLVLFGGNILQALGLTFVVLAVLGQVGVETASLIAVLGAASLAVGLALQGSLANLAAGVMIIVFRPFRVGDYVEANGIGGMVEGLNIFTTRLVTPDNKTVIIPNSKVTDGNIVNYMAKNSRRLDLVFGIGYGDDIKKAKTIMERIIAEDERILADPAPVVAVLELADSSVNFAFRPWVKTLEYWDVRFDMIEKVKLAFDAEGITIPFPQRDVYMHMASDAAQKMVANTNG